jgi:cell division control protein 45
MAMLKEGPDLRLFTHPGALTKLALWVAEAMCELEGIQGRKGGELVLASLDEERGVYVVVGLGGGSAVSAQKERDAKVAEKRKEREKRKQDRRVEKERERELRRRRLEALGEDDDDDSESESSDSDDSSDEEEEEERSDYGKGFNRFGNAFQEAVGETSARVKVDSFEHCVVEVQKDDFRVFLESLCKKAVVG